MYFSKQKFFCEKISEKKIVKKVDLWEKSLGSGNKSTNKIVLFWRKSINKLCAIEISVIQINLPKNSDFFFRKSRSQNDSKLGLVI